MLKSYIEQRLRDKNILLMTHIVIGYPSFDASFKIIEAMVTAGVDLIELQIPFSEPIADGPVILRANQESLAAGTRVADCIAFAGKVTRTFDVPFLFMTYYNILFKYGVDRFVADSADRGIQGMIVPDLPPEEGSEYLTAMNRHSLSPVYIYTPMTSDTRMKKLAEYGRGFMYCVARKGVTGKDTDFSDTLDQYLARCRKASDLPLALGFGVKNRDDISFLTGKADIAVIGTEMIRLIDNSGVDAIIPFIRELR